MSDLSETAPAFVAMAHRTVWASVATVDAHGRPRSRVLHPIWVWDGARLVGWVGTTPTPVKRAHLSASPFASVSYWAPTHDNAIADCRAALAYDDATRSMVWDLFKNGSSPVGYDPGIVPPWKNPTADAFAVIKLEPWRLRLFWEQHPESRTALLRWFQVVRQTRFDNFAELRKTFPAADAVGDWIVFNIGGNKYRLIASIHFNRSKVYVRHVLTHVEYDRGSWKK